MEFILEVIILVLLRYPGAFLRWIFYGGKREFKELLDEDPNINTIVSLLFICFVIIVVLIFNRLSAYLH